jgi:hypothetical protein
MTIYTLDSLRDSKANVHVSPDDLDDAAQFFTKAGITSLDLAEGEHLGSRDWFHGEVDDLVVWTVTVTKNGISASAITHSGAGAPPNLWEIVHVIDSDSEDIDGYGDSLDEWLRYCGDSDSTRRRFEECSQARAFMDVVTS